VIAGGVLSGEVVGLGDANPDSINATMYYYDENNAFNVDGSYNDKIVVGSGTLDDGELTLNDKIVVGSGTLADGELTLKLNETVDERYLEAGFKELEEEYGGKITVSNRNVKIGEADVRAYQSGKAIGQFYYVTGIEDKDWHGYLIYAAAVVSITGTYTDEEGNGRVIYNVFLKKGWNIVYMKETGTEGHRYYEYTTATPSGAKWYYKDDTL
jgi:hypothetical protein